MEHECKELVEARESSVYSDFVIWLNYFEPSVLCVSAKGEETGRVISITFCPFCGEKLDEEVEP